jgi:hypothetical protein
MWSCWLVSPFRERVRGSMDFVVVQSVSVAFIRCFATASLVLLLETTFATSDWST